MNDYQRIAEAIQYIEGQHQQQPDLSSVAAHVGLSEYHFQRLFQRWAGISPKRFLQALTANHAQSLLDDHSVLDTTYAVGLSGPGRLHDLTVNVYAMTPGEIRAGGEGLCIRWDAQPSPFGPCFIAQTERGICALHFLDDEATELEPVLNALHARYPQADFQRDAATAHSIRRIFGQQATDAPLAVWVKGTNFQVRVWEALLTIPAGQTATYQQIAQRIGQPTAARAVGSAIGKNPVGYLIPCHRVIKATGAVGEYRWGSTRKKALLGYEAALN